MYVGVWLALQEAAIRESLPPRHANDLHYFNTLPHCAFSTILLTLPYPTKHFHLAVGNDLCTILLLSQQWTRNFPRAAAKIHNDYCFHSNSNLPRIAPYIHTYMQTYVHTDVQIDVCEDRFSYLPLTWSNIQGFCGFCSSFRICM